MSQRDPDHEPKLIELEELTPEVPPDPALEQRVVAQLRENGLLAADRRRTVFSRVVNRVLLPVAASLVLFAGGALVGARLVPRGSTFEPSGNPPDRDLYALLLYEDSGFDSSGPEHLPERVAESTRWMQDLQQQGRYATGERLGPDGELLHGSQILGQAATGAWGTLAGFFLVEAPNPETALAIASSCPHLGHGGTIEVRHIER